MIRGRGVAKNIIDVAVFSGLGVPGPCRKLQPSCQYRSGDALRAGACARGGTLNGPFSAVSTATIARIGAFFSFCFSRSTRLAHFCTAPNLKL